MTAGANPGSGFDLTIRSVVDALQKEKIVDVPLPVQNRPGGSGADFLATMVEQYQGADDQISVTSLSMMMNQLRGRSTYGYDDVTMIARLMTEYFVVVTGPGSPFKNLGDVMAAIKSDPGRVAVGAATDDEAPFDLLVSAAGGDPSTVRLRHLRGRRRPDRCASQRRHRRGDRRRQRVHRPVKRGTLERARRAGRGAAARARRAHRPGAGARRHAVELARSLRTAGHAGVRGRLLAEGARRDGGIAHVEADRGAQPVHHHVHDR